MEGWIWPTAVAAIIAFLYLLHQWRRKNKKKLPPGPRALPIIGHFHLLTNNPHNDLHRLARKHGPIMYTRFGSVDTIIVSSPSAAELFLKTHDLVFADRPHNEAGYHLNYEQRDIVFGRYGPYWRDMRKLCTLHLLSSLKIAQFEPMRKAEIGNLVESLRAAARGARGEVDLSVAIAAANANMTCLMVFGRKLEDRDFDVRWFKEAMVEVMEEAAAFNLGDYFPCLRWLDLRGSARRLKKLSQVFDAFLERIIDDHVERNEKSLDFVDVLMGIVQSCDAGADNFDRRHVKAVLLDMLIGGMDMSVVAVDWTLSELIKHPNKMKKLQKELEEVVGLNQMVEESHLPTLTYLNCVIKESMRLHPVGPLLVHEAREDCEVSGFHIPKKSRILVNVWAIGRDRKAWIDPEEFVPERFLGSNVDLRGQDFQLIPFGAGRRSCPGLQLGLILTSLMVAQLVHCFDWELRDGAALGNLDMSEHFGFVTSRTKHLMVFPSYRLHN